MSLLSSSDIRTHAKRYTFTGGWAGAAMEAMVYQVGIWFELFVVPQTPPEVIHFNHDDLMQMNAIGGASTFAIVSNAGTAIPSTVTMHPPATSTAS
jgi:hypothetical protein